MEIATVGIKVDVTAALHQALRDFAQEYSDKYGVTIEHIKFNWDNCIGWSQVLSVEIGTLG